MLLPAGSLIGPYEVVSLLGAGGMGEVYRARDSKLKREVAIKVLPEPFASDPSRLARFKREAELLASLNHPNIATIYGVEHEALVMELVEGETPKGPMSFDDAWKMASQIAAALEYAHDRNIVHRDLKPANVKVTADGVVKLLDFGLAKALTADSSPAVNQEHSPTLTLGATQLGVILGTAAYMSPEQAKGKNVDRRADIWAFGVMLYEFLTGDGLFNGEDVSETLAQVLTKEPDLSRAPARARRMLSRCLEKDPKQRLRDIAEARFYLEEPVSTSPPTRRPLLPWIVAAFAVLAGAVALGLRPAVVTPLAIRSTILPPEQSFYRCQGDAAGPAVLSPDGRRLAFTASRRDDKATLWIRPLESSAGQSLPGTQGAMFPFWSPDGRSVGFFADGKLKKIDLASGTVNSIADAPLSRGGAWNRDNTIIFAPNLTSVLMRVQASGGPISSVTRLDEARHELSHRWPSFLPDGMHFLYTSRDKGVFVGRLDQAEPPRRILEESMTAMYRDGYILYASGNTLLARQFNPNAAEFTGPAIALTQSMQSEVLSDRACFTASETGLIAYHTAWGTYQMTWVDRGGNKVATLGEPALLQGVEISPDGKRVATVISDGVASRSLWVYEIDRGVRTRLSSTSNAKYLGMAWSQDSTRLAYGVQTGGSYAVVAKSINESGPEETLFRSNFELTIFQWLANHGMMLMLRDPKTDWDVAYVPPRPTNGEPSPVPVVHSEASESGGYLSPDGRWLVYESNESGGELFEAHIAAFPSGGRRRQLSNGGVDQTTARWSRAGTEIFFTSHMRMFQASVRPAGNSLEVENPRVLFEVAQDCNSFELACYDVTGDGKRFLVHQPTGAPPAIELIQNWPAALKK